jgi:hypothetical protein
MRVGSVSNRDSPISWPREPPDSESPCSAPGGWSTHAHAPLKSDAPYFDLLDIQKVLGHANPATTMRSYIDPLDTGVIRRAAQVLD